MAKQRKCTLSLHDALPIYAEHDVVRVDRIKICALVDGLRRHLTAHARARSASHEVVAQFDVRVLRDELRRRLHVAARRSEEHTSELQSRREIVCRLLLDKK